MLANGGGSSSGMNSSVSSSRQSLPGTGEFEGLLLEFGKPGHWSAGPLANRCGGLPASLVASLDYPQRRLGDLVVVDLSYHGGRPSAFFLRLPLPQDLRRVHHASSTRSCGSAASSSSYSWKVAQLGVVPRGSGGRSWAPLSSGRVVLQPGWVSAPPSWLRGRRSWPVFQHRRKIPRSGTDEEKGLTSAPLTPP